MTYSFTSINAETIEALTSEGATVLPDGLGEWYVHTPQAWECRQEAESDEGLLIAPSGKQFVVSMGYDEEECSPYTSIYQQL